MGTDPKDPVLHPPTLTRNVGLGGRRDSVRDKRGSIRNETRGDTPPPRPCLRVLLPATVRRPEGGHHGPTDTHPHHT